MYRRPPANKLAPRAIWPLTGYLLARILYVDTEGAMLNSKALYLGDNGRCFCGALACAGMTAHYSGRDLSGQRVYKLTARDAAAPGLEAPGFRCEQCGVTLVSLVTVS